MRCEDTSAKLADHLAGTLTDADRQALESHALSCAACREELEGASQMWERLGRVHAPQADSRGMRARFDAMMADVAHSTSADAPAPSSDGRVTPLPVRAESAPVVAPSMRTRTNRWMRRHRTVRPLLQACAAAILVVAGIQVGRKTAPPPSSYKEASQPS